MVLAAVADVAPGNPFFTAAYVQARRACGDHPVVLGVWSGAAVVAACPAYLHRRSRALDIVSLPTLSDGVEEFWPGVLRFCRTQRVRFLSIDSFGSSAASIPPLAHEVSRRARREFVLALGTDPLAGLSSNHRRNVARARARGVTVRRGHTAEARTTHGRLVAASLDRRTARGETVNAGGGVDMSQALMQTGAGELVQAVRGDEVLSSILVLRARCAAYYHSAGTSPDGMAVGASHFLVASLAAALRDEGLQSFNLGGAGDEGGLRRFKEGFGARVVPLEAAQFSTEWTLTRKARTALRLARDNPGGLARSLVARLLTR